MRRKSLLGMVAITLLTLPCAAQQTTVSTPLTVTGDSFFESFNVNWGFQRSSPNGSMFFRFGSPNGAVPPFGGYNPQAASNLGVGFRGGGGSGFLNFSAAQGSQRFTQTTVPSLTVMNGAPGFIQSGSVRPFVTGFVPVVGAAPTGRVTSPLRERLERLKYEQPAPVASQPVSRKPATTRVYPSRRVPGRSTAETPARSVAEIRAERR